MQLKDQALSVTFASTMARFERLDRKLSREVEVAHNATHGIVRTTRSLFPGCDMPLKAVLGKIEHVRNVHEFYSVAWPPVRAVKIEAYPLHRDATKEAIAQFDVALQTFYDEYPRMVEQGLKNSRGLSTPDEYMPREELFNRFSVTITYGQMEDINGWLSVPVLTQEQADELVAQSKASQQRLLDGVLASIKDQLAACFTAARVNLAKKQQQAPTDPNAPKARFNTAWLINLKQLCEMLPAFNLPNDPTIPQLVVDLQPILKHTPETMKSSELAQAEAHTCLETILATYVDWLNS